MLRTLMVSYIVLREKGSQVVVLEIKLYDMKLEAVQSDSDVI